MLGAAPGAQAWVLGCADRWPRLSAVPCPLTALPVPLTALCEHVAERDEGAAALAGESVRGAAGGGAVVAAEQEEIRRQQTDVMSGGTNNVPQQVCATTENYFGFDGDGRIGPTKFCAGLQHCALASVCLLLRARRTSKSYTRATRARR